MIGLYVFEVTVNDERRKIYEVCYYERERALRVTALSTVHPSLTFETEHRLFKSTPDAQAYKKNIEGYGYDVKMYRAVLEEVVEDA